MLMRGTRTLALSLALKMVPSGTAYRSMGRPSMRRTTSSRPQNTAHGHVLGMLPQVTSATACTLERPLASRIFLVRSK